MDKARGFTVLELLATLAIVAIVLGIAVPGMSEAIRRSRLAAAHNEFVSALYLLRSEAAKRNRVVSMCRLVAGSSSSPACDDQAAGGWEAGWAIWVDENGNNGIDADEILIASRPALHADTRLSGNGTNLTRRIAYKPTGTPLGFNNGTFTVCIEALPTARQIIISTAGRIRSRTRASEEVC